MLLTTISLVSSLSQPLISHVPSHSDFLPGLDAHVLQLLRGLSLVAVSGGYSSLQCMGLALQWLLLLWSTGSRHAGFSNCGTWAQQLWLSGLVALWHVGSSQTRAWTHVPCIGRQILNHCATREVPNVNIYIFFNLFIFGCIGSLLLHVGFL